MFSAKDLNFSLIKYLNFLVLGVRGLIIAQILGPHYLGIYSLFLLYQQYFQYGNIGVQYALNLELSRSGHSDEYSNYLVGSGFVVTILSTIFLSVLFIGLSTFEVSLFSEDRQFFLLFLFANTALFNYQDLSINILRVKNELYTIAFLELFSSILILIITQFFEGLELVKNIILWTSVALMISNIVLVRRIGRIHLSFKYVRYLLSISFPILFYHLTFNLLFMGTRSFVVREYTLTTYGNFSFAHSLVNIFLLLTNTLLWVAYPRVVQSLASNFSNTATLINYITNLGRKIYILQLIMSMVAFSLAPAIFYVFPEYRSAQQFYYLLLVSAVFGAMTYPYVTFLLARSKYLCLARVSVYSVVLAFVLFLMLHIMRLDPIWSAVAYCLVLLFYYNMLVYEFIKFNEIKHFIGVNLYSLTFQAILVLIIFALVLNWFVMAKLIVIAACIAYKADIIDLLVGVKRIYGNK